MIKDKSGTIMVLFENETITQNWKNIINANLVYSYIKSFDTPTKFYIHKNRFGRVGKVTLEELEGFIRMAEEFVNKNKQEKNMLIEYIKNRKGERVGTLVGVCEEYEDVVRVGWSYCNTRADKFDKTTGVEIALNRAEPQSLDGAEIPVLIKDRLPGFEERCMQYFQQARAVRMPKKYWRPKSNFGSLKIVSEKEVSYVDMIVDMDETAHQMLVKYAIDHIMDDKDALVNWAVNKLLREHIEGR